MKKKDFLILFFFTLSAVTYSQNSDKAKLNMALDYFQNGKYHEYILLTAPLDSIYDLNPRFKAYLGLSYFYEQEYEKCVFTFNGIIESLQIFAPGERSIYYYSIGESNFQLRNYDKSICSFEKMLNVCDDQEKPEPLYRLGFCYLMKKNKPNAITYFRSALAYYIRYRDIKANKARIKQLENMISELNEK